MNITKEYLKFYKDGANIALNIMEDGRMTIKEAREFINKTVDEWYDENIDEDDEEDDEDEDKGEDIDIRIEVRGFEK